MEASNLVFCVIPLVGLLIVSVIIFAKQASAREKAVAQHLAQARAQLAEARERYETALAQLKERPTDSNLRQAALEAGRAYSAITRGSNLVTVFDEVALKNDLDAAAAGASAAAGPAPVAGPSSAADRLRSLADLKAQGLITEDEFQARRVKILEGV